jgi:hypothetical protein
MDHRPDVKTREWIFLDLLALTLHCFGCVVGFHWVVVLVVVGEVHTLNIECH